MTMVLIQARMSSKRLPGKILKRINGQTILGHVAARCESIVGKQNIVIVTSNEDSDAPVVQFAKSHGYRFYCGSLANVYDRLVGAILTYGIDHFVRVCGDSPFLHPEILAQALTHYRGNSVDLVTNVFPRSYPKGQSVEVIRSSTFLDPEYTNLNGFSNEHVTKGFYSCYTKYTILNFSCSHATSKGLRTWAVDTKEDFVLISEWIKKYPQGPGSFPKSQIKIYNPKIADA